MLGLLVEPEAEADLAQAYDWCEEQRPGLGDDLLLCVEGAIETSRRNPEMFPVVHGEARRALTRRFPSGVFYLVEPERIVRARHLSLEPYPEGWQRRIPTPGSHEETDTVE